MSSDRPSPASGEQTPSFNTRSPAGRAASPAAPVPGTAPSATATAPAANSGTEGVKETEITESPDEAEAPPSAACFIKKAELLGQAHREDEALELLQQLRGCHPREPEGYCRAASIHLDRGEYTRAEALCRKCMQINPSSPGAFILYAEISLRREAYPEAVKRWEQVRRLFPGAPEGYAGGLKAYALLQEWNQVRKLFRKGVRALKAAADRSAPGQLYLQMMHLCTRQPGRARDCVPLAQELEQQFPEATADIRYYNQLADAAFFMAGRDHLPFSDPGLDFILLRLLCQPLSLFPLVLSFLIYLFRTDLQLNPAAVLRRLDRLTQKQQLHNPLAVLTSAAATREARTEAYLKILKNGDYHAALLTWFRPDNPSCLAGACREILKSREWEKFEARTLYRFVKALNFTDQNEADALTAAVAAQTPGTPAPATPLGALCLRHRSRRQLRARTAGLPGTVPAKLTIALCIGGQLRGYRGTLESAAKILGLEKHKVFVFVHTWDTIGRKFPVPFHASRTFSGEFCKTYVELFIRKKNLATYLEQHYPNFYALLLNGNTASLPELQQQFRTDAVVIDREAQPPFAAWPNPHKMYYKIYACHQLAVNSGRHFDLEIRMRPDLDLTAAAPLDLIEFYKKSQEELAVFNNRPRYLAEWARFYVTDDNLALGIPEVMEVYANTYTDLQKYGGGRLYDYPGKYTPHESLACSLYSGGVRICPLPLKFTFRDPDKIPPGAIYRALQQDLEKHHAPAAECRALLRACLKDLQQQGIKAGT